MGQSNYDEIHGDRDDDVEDGDVMCKRCGAEGLTWYKIAAGWRLHETRPGSLRLQIHRCKPTDVAEGEFQDVGE